MATTQFTDDAYNKFPRDSNYDGTLIANWHEERAIRDATGEGRTVPMRHIKRSGLLKDFTKTPSSGPRVMDSTFDRVYGARRFPSYQASSKTIGEGDIPAYIDPYFQGSRQTDSRTIGDRRAAQRNVIHEHVATMTEIDAKILADKREVREFNRESDHHSFQGNQPKAEQSRKSEIKNLWSGGPGEVAKAHDNAGMQVDAKGHFSLQNQVSVYRSSAGEANEKVLMGMTVSNGPAVFGRNASFSTPVGLFMKGPEKTTVVDQEAAFKSSKPQFSTAFIDVSPVLPNLPQLNVVKDAIVEGLRSKNQGHCVCRMRKHFELLADELGFLPLGDVIKELRELGVDSSRVDDIALESFLELLCTMRKGHVCVGDFVAAVRRDEPRTAGLVNDVWDKLMSKSSGEASAAPRDQQAVAISALLEVAMKRDDILEDLGLIAEEVPHQALSYVGFQQYFYDMVAACGAENLPEIFNL